MHLYSQAVCSNIASLLNVFVEYVVLFHCYLVSNFQVWTISTKLATDWRIRRGEVDIGANMANMGLRKTRAPGYGDISTAEGNLISWLEEDKGLYAL